MASKRKRWANDVAVGMLIAGIGMAALAFATAIFPPVTPYALGVVFFGAAVALIGGFEYFNSVVDSHRVEDPRL